MSAGSTSGGVQPRAQGVHPENGRYRHVDPRPVAYSHVNRAYKPKRAGRATWIHIRRRKATCTALHNEKGPAPGRVSGGVQPREQGVHTEKGRHRQVEPRPEVYSRVHRAYIPKRACTGTRIRVRRRAAICRVHRVYNPKRAARGTSIHVGRRSATYTWPIHRKGPAQARGSMTWRRTATRTGPTHQKGRQQARGSTSGGVQPRAVGVHTEKGRPRYVDSRPGADIPVHRAYAPKRAVQERGCTSKSVQPRTRGVHTQRVPTGTWFDDQKRTATCTGRTPRKGPA